MKKDTIVYVMNVDWNWIKQRPHFIAEELNDNYNINVLYQYKYNRKTLQRYNKTLVNLKPIFVIPMGDRFKILSKLNNKIKAKKIKKYIKKFNPNIIYLTFPDQINSIDDSYKGMVIYDCMDNHPEFLNDSIKKNKLIMQEKKLVNRADLIFTSSNHLKSVLIERYGNILKNRIRLVRNGYNGELLDDIDSQKIKKGLFTISYFGTIGPWFNFDYIIRSLEDFDDINYEIYGPISNVSFPKHERLNYNGIIEHNNLWDSVKESDCFIMPFIIDDIIKCVDPVKLYEYINFKKDIIVPYYTEINRFSNFVYFYDDYNEFKESIINIRNSNKVKYSNEERYNFLKMNSWHNRAIMISDYIKEFRR